MSGIGAVSACMSGVSWPLIAPPACRLALLPPGVKTGADSGSKMADLAVGGGVDAVFTPK